MLLITENEKTSHPGLQIKEQLSQQRICFPRYLQDELSLNVHHQKQLFAETASDTGIYQAAMELFDELWDGRPIRLLGIRTSKLVREDEPWQMSIFDLPHAQAPARTGQMAKRTAKAGKGSVPGEKLAEAREQKRSSANALKQEKLSRALDQIRQKFGEDAVVRGSFLKKAEDDTND